MAITLKQAKDARESCADVFTPAGDAGVIADLRKFGSRSNEWAALVTGRLVQGWYPLSNLNTAETL